MCQELYFICIVLFNLHNSGEGGIIIILDLYLRKLRGGVEEMMELPKFMQLVTVRLVFKSK